MTRQPKSVNRQPDREEVRGIIPLQRERPERPAPALTRHDATLSVRERLCRIEALWRGSPLIRNDFFLRRHEDVRFQAPSAASRAVDETRSTAPPVGPLRRTLLSAVAAAPAEAGRGGTMMRRILIAMVVLCVTPCFAVDLRDTAWAGQGAITVTLNGQSESEPFEGTIVFTGSSPKKGAAALGDLACKWTSKSVSSPSFTLIPLQAAANQIAAGVRAQLPGAKVKVTPKPMQGSASLQTGTITYAVRFKVSVKYMGSRYSGFVTIDQSGYQLTALTAADRCAPLLPKLHAAIADLLDR